MRFHFAGFVLMLGLALPAWGQALAGAGATNGDFARQFWRDQANILSSPLKIRQRDWRWLLPAAGATAFLIATDSRNMQDRIHSDPQARDRSLAASNLGIGILAAVPAAIGWRGWRERDGYQEGTAWLTARAVADTIIATELVRGVTRRQRPQGSDAGEFFQATGGSSSFPSLHSASAWAIASVVAHRYPGWLTRLAVYGIAGGVSASRVLGREHSPSDVFVGGALGWLIGRYVSGGGEKPWWNRLTPSAPGSAQPILDRSADDRPSGMVYVPLDSWIYPALDRLAALSLIPSQTAGLRPWTRSECRRQIAEAESRLATAEGAVAGIVRALRAELDRDTGTLAIDTLYASNGLIAGPPLADSFHFGQTWSNDFGRPFGRGWNSYDGVTAHAETGRFFAYADVEFQHASGIQPYALNVRQTLANLDAVPLQPANPASTTDRFRALDAYVGARVGDFEFSVGKQSLWWGPTADSPLSFGTNAEPTKNFRASMIHPVRLPGMLGRLGEIRGELVFGKLGGQKYTWRPWFNAQKITFKLTENLEMGFTRWSIFWGVGHPITLHSLERNFTSMNSPDDGVGTRDPGDRKGGFDFRYRVPGLRNWLTVYSDSYSDDDPSPLAAPRRAAINPGIYLTHIPGVARLDFRVEAPSTMPMEGDMGGTFIYYNSQYKSGNTNYGYLLGNPVGRDARAIEARSTYWFSERGKLQAGYRQLKGGSQFLPGGITQSDATMKASLPLSQQCTAGIAVQYERFWAPLLGGPAHNWSGSLTLECEPNLQILKRDERK